MNPGRPIETRTRLFTKSSVIALTLLMLCMTLTTRSEASRSMQTSPDDALRESLAAEGIGVTRVLLEGQRIGIAYTQSPGVDMESMFFTWLTVMQAAVEEYPEVEEVLVIVENWETPFLLISAGRPSIDAALAGTLALADFFAGLGVEDVRSPGDKIEDSLLEAGIFDADLVVGSGEIRVELQRPLVGSPDEIISLLSTVLSRVVLHAPENAALRLQMWTPAGNPVSFVTNTSAVRAYLSGQSSSAELFSSLAVEGLNREADAQPAAAAWIWGGVYLLGGSLAGIAGLGFRRRLLRNRALFWVILLAAIASALLGLLIMVIAIIA